MHTTTSITPAHIAIAAATRAAQHPGRRGGSVHAARAWIGAGCAVLVMAFGFALDNAGEDTLAPQLQAFQQRVVATGTTADAEPAATVLARRYLEALPLDTRLHISEQVRDEQRAGVTPAGNEAFVMRRLALYEAALQQTRTIGAARGL